MAGKGGMLLFLAMRVQAAKKKGKELKESINGYLKSVLRKEQYTPVENENGDIGVKTPKGIKYVPQNVELKDVPDVVQYFKDTIGSPQEFLYEEPPDDVLVKGRFDKKQAALPEYYEGELLPASRVPNIMALKTWIETVKWANMSPIDLRLEYNKHKGTTADTPLNAQQRSALLDSVAYMISRKFWYVGRRSAQETDAQFNERTKHMRPAMGSFSPNDTWKAQTFPYDETYQYSAGEIPELEEKLKGGETIKW